MQYIDLNWFRHLKITAGIKARSKPVNYQGPLITRGPPSIGFTAYTVSDVSASFHSWPLNRTVTWQSEFS